MTKFIAAIVAASTLLVAAESRACNPVQAIVAAPVYAQQFVAAPVVYQAQVQAVQVQAVAYTPVVQQVVVKQQRVRRHPVRRAAQVVLPPYGCR